jgi:predicted nucleotide-binding protein (sugar kinase/HSP70/actin superfamily)/methylmalonyl-CoA mutase cobalamin-binding subunit
MPKSSFIGLDAMEKFGWEKRPGQICQFCSNNCNRTIVVFSDGRTHVTGNRCERGEVIANPDDPETKKTVAEINRKINSVPDMIKRANQLLVKDYQPQTVWNKGQRAKIGIPRALEFFVSLPFWKAFFTSLGFEVVVSRQSDYNLFEEGLRSVPSDTICFPAKLLHGHVADLVKKKVDRIFMPVMMAVPTDHKKFKATAVCPVVQGSPAVVRNIDDPEKKHGIPVDQPNFYWYNEDLRRSQCIDWVGKKWRIPKKNVDAAVNEGEVALQKFRDTLQSEGQKVLNDARAKGEFVVVVAGRPYHLDPLVNHLVANHFTQMGISVLPLEALPEAFNQDIPPNTRMETLNSFHMRMLGATLLATKDPSIELVQIVSFGCGHDAILSDEMMRILHERSNKELLMLKLDEGDVRGPLSIRIKSFIETVKVRHEVENTKMRVISNNAFPSLFSVPYAKEDKKKRVILIPNLSPAFSFLCAKVMERQDFKTEVLHLADKRALEIEKKYVHNDICFPAQVNIGEGLLWLEQHPELSQDEVCMGLAKNCENCRAGQYAVVCRKALDEAGYPGVPILTTGADTKNMHPGFNAGVDFRLHMLWGMAMMDGIEIMFRAVRPYEKNHGESLRVYNYWIKETMQEAAGNIRGALKKFEQAIEAFNNIEADMSVRRPRVAVLGEILMKYHPSANGYVEEYLFEHGMEVVQPGMLDFFRVGELVRMEKVRRGLITHPFVNWLIGGISSKLYSKAVSDIEKRIKKFKFYEHHADCYEMSDIIEKTGMLDKTYVTGEGWLIPGEVLSLAEHGVNSFIILQPFACLANHISGRGLTKAMKSKFPHIQVLSLDYDPDTSFANIENRLQMLIINAKELEKVCSV